MEIPQPIVVPITSLSAEAQQGVIDEFIWREGTDYGWQEASHDKKRTDILRQIERGEILLTFSPGDESLTLMTKREFAKIPRTEPKPSAVESD